MPESPDEAIGDIMTELAQTGASVIDIPCNTTRRGAPEIPQGRACALRDMTKARNPVSERTRTDLLIEARRLATNIDAIIIPHSCVHERKGAYHE